MSICLGTPLGIFLTAHIGPTRKRCGTLQTHRHRGTTTRHSLIELAPVRAHALRLAQKLQHSPHRPLSHSIPNKNHFRPTTMTRAAYQFSDVAHASPAISGSHMHCGRREGRIIGLQPPRRGQ